MVHIWMWNTILLIGNTFCIMVLYLNMWIKYDGIGFWIIVYLGYLIIMTPRHYQICWTGGMKRLLLVRWHKVWAGANIVCLKEEFWCYSISCLSTNRQLAFNLDCEGANSTTINHFPFFYALFLSISVHCAPPLSHSLSPSVSDALSLTHTHTHAQTHTTGEV